MGFVYLFLLFIAIGVVAIVYGYVGTFKQHYDKERSWHAIWWIGWGTIVLIMVGVMSLINHLLQ